MAAKRKRRRGLGASEGQHHDLYNHAKMDFEDAASRARAALDRGDCSRATVQLNQTYLSLGRASAHIQSHTNAARRTHLADTFGAQGLIKARQLRDDYEGVCVVRKARKG